MTCLLGASATPAAAGVPAPEAFGPLAVATSTVKIPMPLDPAGPEGLLPDVVADVYVPRGAAGPWPLVQISHAWPGTVREFPLSGWARRLASRGFVVIVSDRRDASSLALAPFLDQPSDVADLSTEVNSEDILRVLRWALAQSADPSSFLHGEVDPQRLAIVGHSLGGYFATFAAVYSQTEGPHLSALLLLDPADERLGTLTLQSSLLEAPAIAMPTMVLGSEESQHPVMCDYNDGVDCTLAAHEEYLALSNPTVKLGLKVAGALHDDVEDPPTNTGPETVAHLRTFEHYGMAWLEYWAGGDCAEAPLLAGTAAGTELWPGASKLRGCPTSAPVGHPIAPSRAHRPRTTRRTHDSRSRRPRPTRAHRHRRSHYHRARRTGAGRTP